MEWFAENCMICSKPLEYFETAQTMNCSICGIQRSTNAACEDGHFVCDSCHSNKGWSSITFNTSKTSSLNPIKTATDIMRNQAINMHGPEHHYLVVASLLAAYRNAGGKIDWGTALPSARQRAENVPGGICGLWGSCGAGIAIGIFVSIITGATPLSEEEWSWANQSTSRALAVISEHGGPRCCKRNSYLAIQQAVILVKEKFDIHMELPERVTCEFSPRNKQCRKDRCQFYVNEIMI